MHPRRHDVIPCPFGGGPAEDGGLDLEEAVLLQELPGQMDELAPELHSLDHLGPSEVQIPVFQTDVLIGQNPFLLVPELERRHDGSVQKLGACDQNLDLPGGIPGVIGAFDPLPDYPVDRHDAFAGESGHHLLDLALVASGGKVFRIENDLGDPVSVCEIYERDPAVVPGKPYPPLQAYLLPEVRCPQVSACVCSSHERASANATRYSEAI